MIIFSKFSKSSFQANPMPHLQRQFRATSRFKGPRAVPGTPPRNVQLRHSRNLEQHRPLHLRRQQDHLRVRPTWMPATLHLLLKFHEAQKNAHHCGQQRFEHIVSGNVRRYIANRWQATFRREKVSVQPVLQEISDVKRPQASRCRPHR